MCFCAWLVLGQGRLVRFAHLVPHTRKAAVCAFGLYTVSGCLYIACTMGEIKFDKRAQTRFIKHLRKHGLLFRAAEAANVTTETVRNHRKDDPAFEERYTMALELYRDDVEAEAHRRAIEGVDEDHYFKGDYTHTVTRYSDRLMELILKRHRPQYRDKLAVDATVNGGVLVMPSNALTSKQWEEENHDGTPDADG